MNSQQTEPPVVLGLMGLPGAGKSHMAARLVRMTGWILLNRDRIRLDHFPDGRYDRAATETAATIMANCLDHEISAGRNLILDGMTLTRRADRRRWADRTHQAGGEWRLIFLDCPLDTAIRRVEADRRTGRHPAGDRDADLVRSVGERLDYPADYEKACVLHEGEGADDVLAWLALQGPGGAGNGKSVCRPG